ncbi:MAG TPA: CsgG/HfaB family protein [Gemmatimonadaceae bacterium]|nr:CsgG/HfaB family protein [Gemmatimonadaceae bacterium]
MLTSRSAAHASLSSLAAALLVVAAAARPVCAQTTATARPTVAVMDFSNGAIGSAHEELAPLSGGIGDLLAGELAANPNIRLVERKQVRQLLDEQELAGTRAIDAQTAVRVGRLLGVQHMIFGGFVTDRSGTMQLHARAVNVETGVIEHVERVSDRADNFMAMISRLAQQLNGGMKLPAPPAGSRELGRAHDHAGGASGRAPVPFQAVLLYSRAVRAEDGGDRAQAVELYRKTLSAFPSYAPARRALDRIASAPGDR